eukprot:SM000367S13683  [mRNA]  locus=s367:4849:12026:- [translate_table: standard]
MRSTPAKSLLVECIDAVVPGLTHHGLLVRLSLEKLQELVADADPNLKYHGLRGMSRLMRSHPAAVAELQPDIMTCLDHADATIRSCALGLVTALVNCSTMRKAADLLVQRMHTTADSSFRDQLAGAVLALPGPDYDRLVDGDGAWYIAVLVDIAAAEGASHGKEVARQLLELAQLPKKVTARDVVSALPRLLNDPRLLGGPPDFFTAQHALGTAAWLVGEHAQLQSDGDLRQVMEAMLQPRIRLLPTEVQAVYVQALLKVVLVLAVRSLADTSEKHGRHHVPAQGSSGRASSNCAQVAELPSHSQDASDRRPTDAMRQAAELLSGHLVELAMSCDMEVQERANNLAVVLELAQSTSAEDAAALQELQAVMARPLGSPANPAAPPVEIPSGLLLLDNLDSLLPHGQSPLSHGQPPGSSTSSVNDDSSERVFDGGAGPMPAAAAGPQDDLGAQSRELHAKHRQRHKLFYLPVEVGPMGMEELRAGDGSPEGDVERVKKKGPRGLAMMPPLPAVVIDAGSGYTKLGFAGNLEPSFTVPTCIALNRAAAGASGVQLQCGVAADLDFAIGDAAAALSHSALHEIVSPIRHGQVDNWDAMERFLQHCIFNNLRCNPEDHCFLMTECPLTPPEHRDYTAEVMFETFNVRGLHIADQAVLALAGNYSTDQTSVSGVVVDSGDGVTHVVPVAEGFVVESAIKSFPIAGRDLSSFLQQLLRKRGERLLADEPLDVARRIKEAHCYTCSDIQKETSKHEKEPEKYLREWVGSNQRTGQQYRVRVCQERFVIPEVYFSAGLCGSNFQTALPELIDSCIQLSPIDTRRALYKVLTGIVTLAWPFKDCWAVRMLSACHTKAEYDEYGPSVCRTKPVQRAGS